MSFKIITQGNVLMRGKNKDVTACDLQIGIEVSQALLTFIFKVYEWVEEGEEAAPPNANVYLPSYMSATLHTTITALGASNICI
jgi:hypothetical protein